ncbi:MAG: metalloprotease PmbA [Gammaproteobacteria bacterium]|nr:metalloprotease PmbA [Gammaproteobacteria bacterium]
MNRPDNNNNRAELEDIIQQVLDAAKSAGATSAEADIGTGNGLSVTVRMGELETIEHQRDKGLSLTVYLGQKKASASTTDFTSQAIADAARAACTIAKNAGADEHAGLIDAKYLAQQIPDLDLFHPWDIEPDEAVELALQCEHEARQMDPRINNSDGSLLNTYSGCHIYGNTNGFIGGWNWSSHTIDCTVIAEQDGNMQRDGWYSKARDRNDLQDIKDVGREAASRTVARLGARKLSTRNVPVIFEAPVAGSLFSAFISAISGSALYREASFLLNKLNQQVFADHIHIHEQPHLKKALGSAPFDNNGMATRVRDLVKDGILQGYLLSAYSARKLGMAPTGNAGGVHNLIIESGPYDLSGLIKKMGTGLLITDMIGFGVNQVTGDFSRGASGVWIEGGEIQYPVEEITVAGNLIEMYKQIVEIANDIERRGNIQTGSVLIESMIVAGE